MRGVISREMAIGVISLLFVFAAMNAMADGAELFNAKSEQFLAGIVSPLSVVPADIDSDGDVDVFVLTSTEFFWLENDGSVAFTAPHSIYQTRTSYSDYSGNPYGNVHNYKMVSGDFDGDGDVDLATYIDTYAFDGSYSYANGHQVQWHQNDGGGSFTAAEVIADLKNPYYVMDILPVDVNADNEFDLLTAISLTNSNSTYMNTDQDDNICCGKWIYQYLHDSFVMVNESSGNAPTPFADGEHYMVDVTNTSVWEYKYSWSSSNEQSETTKVRKMAAGDFDKDGLTDIVLGFDVNGGTDFLVGLAVLFNRGASGWEEQEIFSRVFDSSSSSGTFFRALEVGDVDNDGKVDIVASYSDSMQTRLDWWRSDGAGGFTYGNIREEDSISQHLHEGGRGLWIIDIDDDQRNDVITSSSYYWLYKASYDASDGTFTHEPLVKLDGLAESTYTIVGERYTAPVAFADLDQDGDYDIIYVLNNDNEVLWVENLLYNGGSGDGSGSDGEGEGKGKDEDDDDEEGDVVLYGALLVASLVLNCICISTAFYCCAKCREKGETPKGEKPTKENENENDSAAQEKAKAAEKHALALKAKNARKANPKWIPTEEEMDFI